MKVHELLNAENRWTQRQLARTGSGVKVHYSSPDASCWCLMGAVCKCYPVDSERRRVMDLIDECTLKRFDVGFVTWNDDPQTTYADVFKLVKELNI